MTCEHTKKINEIISSLLNNISDTDSSFYERSGPFFKREDIGTELNVEGGMFSKEYRERVVLKKEKETYVKLIKVSDLRKELNNIGKLTINCHCYEDAQENHKNSETKFNISTEIKNMKISNLEEGKQSIEEELKNFTNQNRELDVLLKDLHEKNASNKTQVELQKTEITEKSELLEQKQQRVEVLLISNAKNEEKLGRMENVEIQLQSDSEKIINLQNTISCQEKKLLEKKAEIFSLHMQLIQFQVKDLDNDFNSTEEELD